MHILVSALVFAALLGVLVVFHEFGHFTAAKLAGMKVFEFAFGFGPKILLLFKRGGTEFNVRAVPLGGFVRIAGMEPGEESEVEGGFNSKPIWQRMMVIVAGPFMSLVLGFLVFIVIGVAWGFSQAGTTVQGMPGDSAAAAAGIRKGDTIVAVDGHRTPDGYVLRKVVSGGKKPVTLVVVNRNGQRLEFRVAPKMVKVGLRQLGVRLNEGKATVAEAPQDYPAAKAGIRKGDVIVAVDGKKLSAVSAEHKISPAEALGGVVNSGSNAVLKVDVMRSGRPLVIHIAPRVDMDDTARQLGVQLNSYKVGRGIVGGLKYGSIETVRWASDTVEGLFSKQIKNAGGIVAIGYATSNAVGSQKNAVEAVFFLLAQLSLGLAVLNLIPWPVLDGGHIVYLLVEKIRGRKLAPSTWYAIQSAGLVIIVMLAIFMVGYDVLRIGKWTGLQ